MPKTTRRKIYAYYALKDFVLLYPLYSLFFADSGLSTFQISTLFVIWSVTDLLVNVPTGTLADRYSRKNLLSIGALITAMGFGLWWLVPSYYGFAMGFVLWGIGGALSDGTFEALVYDELKAEGNENQYVKVMGRVRTYGMVAVFPYKSFFRQNLFILSDKSNAKSLLTIIY